MNRQIAAILLVALAGSARAGYDKTKWGMTSPQVEKLYPGGHEGEQAGESAYAVLGTFAGNPALVTFLFHAKDGLHSVTVVFPEQGSKFDPEAESPAPLSVNDAARVREAVRQELVKRYGPPAIQGEGPDTPVGWVTRDGDLVVLRTAREGPDRVTVSLSFTKA